MVRTLSVHQDISIPFVFKAAETYSGSFPTVLLPSRPRTTSGVPSPGEEDSRLSSSSRKLSSWTINDNKMNFGRVTNSNGMSLVKAKWFSLTGTGRDEVFSQT